MTYTLVPRYEDVKSYYGKALVIANNSDNTLTLVSYDTQVAKLQFSGSTDTPDTATVYGLYSATTTRHIKEFLKQSDFKAESSKQLITDYGVKN